VIANSNGPSPSRPVIFQTRTAAERFAIRSAQVLSRRGVASPVEHVNGAFTPSGGGQCYSVEPAPGQLGEWLVIELPASELGRRQQAGMRAAIAKLYGEADAWTVQALASRLGAVRGLCFTHARQAREQARALELHLTVSGVQRAEPFKMEAVSL
jgi:hypothetical protein